MKQWFIDLKSAPLATLEITQDGRAIWAVMASACVLLLAIAGIYFQGYLGGEPCEQCVYIRESQFIMLFGALIIMIKPSNHVPKILGMAVAWLGIVYGMYCSFVLHDIEQAMMLMNSDSSMDIFSSGVGANACSLEPTFITGLPLHEWWPMEFQPGGICGEFEWSLLGLGMAGWCIINYAIFVICVLPLTIAYFTKTLRGNV